MENYSESEIRSIIDNMSLDAKVGQLFLLAYPGKNVETIAPLIEQYGICGCYISQDNAESFAEARKISSELQDMSLSRNEKIPLLLGVDQEGAWGVLVPESHTGPGNLALGALEDLQGLRDIYRNYGREMLSVGYNTLLGPCADVNIDPESPIIGTRSFGEFPEKVARCVSSAVEGASETGVLTTLKHFPGHGGTAGDTHREIPRVDKSLEQLQKEDLLPFAAGIESGADIIMTSHILYPQIDKKNPATMSRIILEDILRKEMGFEGVILSDSMNMGAIRLFYDPAESTLLALKAGVDIIMLSEEHYDHSSDYLGKQTASLEYVKKAILDGELSMAQVDEKLMRILFMKLNKMIKNRPELTESESDEIKICEKRVAEESFVLLQKCMWPIGENSSILCINATPRSSYSNLINSRGIGPNQKKPAFDSFRETLEKLDPSVSFLSYEDSPVDNREKLEKADILVVVTEDYPLPGEDFTKTEQQKLVVELSDNYGKKLVILGLRSSYELSLYPENVTYLCSFSSRTCSAEAAARILHEKKRHFFARSPVSSRI